jgi:hypothetical protein
MTCPGYALGYCHPDPAALRVIAIFKFEIDELIAMHRGVVDARDCLP